VSPREWERDVERSRKLRMERMKVGILSFHNSKLFLKGNGRRRKESAKGSASGEKSQRRKL